MKSKSPLIIQKKVLLREIEQLAKSEDFDIHSLARTNIRNIALIKELLST
jgi:hypothetical protein